jgi:hypothetical protein
MAGVGVKVSVPPSFSRPVILPPAGRAGHVVMVPEPWGLRIHSRSAEVDSWLNWSG